MLQRRRRFGQIGFARRRQRHRAARAMKEQDSRRDSVFRQSVEAQKNSSELLEKKFQEAVKKAKESPDTGRPIRDFDLD